jgi:hypothetical protein
LWQALEPDRMAATLRQTLSPSVPSRAGVTQLAECLLPKRSVTPREPPRPHNGDSAAAPV